MKFPLTSLRLTGGGLMPSGKRLEKNLTWGFEMVVQLLEFKFLMQDTRAQLQRRQSNGDMKPPLQGTFAQLQQHDVDI